MFDGHNVALVNLISNLFSLSFYLSVIAVNRPDFVQ